MHGFQPTHHDRSPRSDRICRRPKDLVVFCWQLMFSTPPSWKDAGPPIGSSTHIGIFRSKMLETSNLLLLSSWKWWNAASLRSSCDTFVRTIQLKLCLFFNVCVFAETRTLKSSALLVFVWKPPHLLLDNKCFESSLWNHKTTRKPKWDREDERIAQFPTTDRFGLCKLCALSRLSAVDRRSVDRAATAMAIEVLGKKLETSALEGKGRPEMTVSNDTPITYHDGLK